MPTMTADQVQELLERVRSGYVPTADEMLDALDWGCEELDRRRAAVLKSAERGAS